MTRGRTTVMAGALLALAALTAPLGWAWAQVTIETQPRESAPPSSIVVTPPATTTTVPGTVTIPQTLQADEIKATQVRANTIYANKIEADQIRGMIHQSRGVKVRNTEGDVKAPEVVASIIYADKITARSVIADNVYVRDLKRR